MDMKRSGALKIREFEGVDEFIRNAPQCVPNEPELFWRRKEEEWPEDEC